MPSVELVALDEAALRRDYDALRALTADLGWDDWGLENFLKPVPGKWRVSYRFVAGAETVGYAIASAPGEGVHIHRFMVGTAHRGAGVGGAALDALCRRYRRDGFVEVTVKTPADNDGAARFYKAHGFRREGDGAGGYLAFRRALP